VRMKKPFALLAFSRKALNVIWSLSLLTVLVAAGIYLFHATANAQDSDAEIEQLTKSLIELNGKEDKDENQLQQVALKRKELLVAKAKTDPSSFLSLATLVAKKGDFPVHIQADLEEMVEEEGELIVVHLDSVDNTKSRTDYKLKTSRGNEVKVYDLHFAQSSPRLLTGSRVKVKAVNVNDEIARWKGRGQHREKRARYFPCCHTCPLRIN
jgi:hypothetical protein